MTANPPPRNPQALPTQTPPFLTKLYQLVSDPNTQNLVSWTDEKGLSFTVHKPSEFGRDILPKYFKHNNFSSFVRQLNQYGFHKQNPDKWMFGHDSFRRDRPDLLKNISRRRPKQAQNSNLVLPTALTQNAVVELGNYGLEGELKSLKRDKDVLIKELVVTRQKEEQLKNRCENLETRVASLENSSKQMQAFIMHYFSQVLQPYSEAMASRKRKRLPATVEEPDAMIVEQPPNQVANISHSAGHSSVDALRVMMQQMGVGISRPPPQPQAQSPSSPQTPPRISFEPATIQELPQEESSATVSTSRRIMPPTAENTVALIHPPVFTQPVLTENPSTGPSTSISPSVPTPASGKSNAPSTSSQCVPVTSNVPSFNAPSPMSTPVIPEKVSANTTNAVTAARTPSQPIARTPNGSAPLASTPNSNNVNGSENTSSSIVSLPTLSVLPTPTVAASSSSPSDANHITSNTTMTSIPTSATNGTISNFNGAHAPIPESEASQFSTHQSSAIATPPALAAAYQAVHVVPLQTHPLPAHPLPTHPLQAHPSNTLPPNTLPPNVDPSNTHLLQSQHLHVNPIQGNVGVSTQELPATYLQTSEQPHVPFPELASTLAPSSNAVNNGNVGAEKTAGKEDIHMTNPEDGKMATSDGEKHVIDPDVERALDFLGDMPSTPNTSMTMDAIENALQAPRSQSKGTHLDTPDFDKAFDDKEFNMSFGNGQGSTKMNGQCPSSSENERVIEDFLELSADDPGLPLPLMHLPEGTDIHALAKRIESFADT